MCCWPVFPLPTAMIGYVALLLAKNTFIRIMNRLATLKRECRDGEVR